MKRLESKAEEVELLWTEETEEEMQGGFADEELDEEGEETEIGFTAATQ